MEKWFKFYSADYLVDGKIRAMNGNERSCFLTLLCLADTSNIPGFIKNLPETDLLWLSGLDIQKEEWQETLGILDKFQNMGILIRNDNDCIEIKNFRKRQGEALSAYERVKKQRALIRKDNKMIRNDTDDNEMIRYRREEKRIEKKRKEENRKEKNTIISAEPNEENQLFKLFYETINPNINYAHKGNRNDATWLIGKYGIEKVINAAKFAISVQGKPYAPTINTPSQLKNKMADLVAYQKREEGKNINQSKTLIL